MLCAPFPSCTYGCCGRHRASWTVTSFVQGRQKLQHGVSAGWCLFMSLVAATNEYVDVNKLAGIISTLLHRSRMLSQTVANANYTNARGPVDRSSMK